MFEFESMKDMDRRLRGCGSGDQVRAVIAGIKKINKAGGCLDRQNASTALFHLAVALSGGNAIEVLNHTLFMASATVDGDDLVD